jgi:hypothetical protein
MKRKDKRFRFVEQTGTVFMSLDRRMVPADYADDAACFPISHLTLKYTVREAGADYADSHPLQKISVQSAHNFCIYK